MSQTHDWAEFANAFELGLTDVHKDELKKLPKLYAPWLKETSAKRFYDTDWVVSGLGVMPAKAIGGDIETDKILAGPTKRHDITPYALALVFQYEVYRWDLYGIFKPLAGELAKSAVTRHNLVAYGFFNQAFTVTDAEYKTYQLEAPCTATHTRLDGGTWSNRLANDDGLSHEGLQKALILLRKTVNERGQYGMLMAKLLIVPVDSEWLAEVQVQSTGRPGTADNDKNTIKGRFNIHSSVYITTAANWWMMVDKSDPCFKVKMRIGDRPDLQRDGDVRTRNRVVTSYCSFGFATFDTKGLVGSTGGA